MRTMPQEPNISSVSLPRGKGPAPDTLHQTRRTPSVGWADFPDSGRLFRLGQQLVANYPGWTNGRGKAGGTGLRTNRGR